MVNLTNWYTPLLIQAVESKYFSSFDTDIFSQIEYSVELERNKTFVPMMNLGETCNLARQGGRNDRSGPTDSSRSQLDFLQQFPINLTGKLDLLLNNQKCNWKFDSFNLHYTLHQLHSRNG